MGEKTTIEWTRGDDGALGATWNPVRGCSRITPGCGGPNHEGGCYAEKIAARFSDIGQPYHGFAERTKHGGRWTGKLALIESALDHPLRWRTPRRIFVNSMSDLFHEALPDEAIDRVFAVMWMAPQHTYQVLTKRADRMRSYCNDAKRPGKIFAEAEKIAHQRPLLNGNLVAAWDYTFNVPRHVWLGTSVEDSARKYRIDDLRATPAAIRFLSLEPLLGDLGTLDLTGISWVIVGGESGPNARPMHPNWARSLRDQCAAAGVPFFFKQHGEYRACLDGEWHGAGPSGRPPQLAIGPTGETAGGFLTQELSDRREREGWVGVTRVGKHKAGRTLDGRTHDEFPA